MKEVQTADNDSDKAQVSVHKANDKSKATTNATETKAAGTKAEPTKKNEGNQAEEPESKSADASGAAMPSAAERMNRALEAQNLWDASMANAIALHLSGYPGSHVIHVTGSFHVSRHLGTPEHLARYAPDASALVVMMMPSKDFPAFDTKDMGGQGDFVFVTDPSVKKSLEDAEMIAADEAADDQAADEDGEANHAEAADDDNAGEEQ